MKLPRQALPLLLLWINDSEPIRNKTRFQKIAFIVENEVKELNNFFEESCEWIPYAYGPYSDDLSEDIELLEKWGLIEVLNKDDENEIIYRITKKGKEIVEKKVLRYIPNDILDKLIEIKKKYNNMPIISILKEVYTKYPTFATASKIKDIILH